MSDSSKRAEGLSVAEKRGLVARRLQEQAYVPRTLPLSSAQQRLWFLDQLEPGSFAYNIAGAMRLAGDLNLPALEQSLGQVIQRHESLRTTVAAVDHQPVQMVAPVGAPNLVLIDLAALPLEQRETEALRVARAEAQRPFDLAEGPLFRTTLLRLGDHEHMLLLTMHHIISDGWSIGVLFRELGQLYEAAVTGRHAGLRPLPIQYGDYAVWQRQQLQGEALRAQLDHWRKLLGDQLPVLQLPTDHPRPPVQTFRGARENITLPKRLSDAIRALGRQEGATLFMTLLAAWQVLLSRYTGQEEFLVGSPVANRSRSEVEGLIGFFVNTLVLKADLSGHPSFRQLLRRVREMALDAFAHQEVPFEQLVAELHPERSLSHHPLFQVMFALQNAPVGSLNLHGLTLSPVPVEPGIAQFELTLTMMEKAEGLFASLEYNSDLFQPETARRMLGHLQRLLEAATDQPDESIAALPILPEEERERLLVSFGQTPGALPDRTVHELFAAEAAKTPDGTALTCGEQRWTYRDLNARANRIAARLRSLGVGPEALVGIALPRSPELVAGLLGILKAGGAYVPLDPGYPHERLAYMLADSGVQVLVTSSAVAPQLPAHAAHVLLLDEDWPAIARESDADPVPAAGLEHPAYVIYTSGSTGLPKGVVVTHGGLANHCQAVGEAYGLSPGDRVLQFASVSFDVAAEELYPALTRGAAVVLPPEGPVLAPDELLEWADREQLTVLNLPAAYWHQLVDDLDRSGRPLPARLRLVITGSERVMPDRYRRWQDLTGGRIAWINAYGPTEATITATLYIASGLLEPGREVPIGRAIANVQTYILDANRQPVPVGVPGELYIGGAGVARGYLNRPELTEGRFVPNPFGPGRLYRTGDLARYWPDRLIEFMGRSDRQVKVRGYRIEPGEVEAALSLHPDVRAVAVATYETARAGANLAAYVVTSAGTAALRSYLQERLPGYMVPSAFVTLPDLPKLPNGKVDYAALPAPAPADLGAGAQESATVGPRTPVEEMLAGIWADVLGRETVSVTDNFFDIGGHSLLATQVMARIRDSFRKEIALRTLFEHPTIAGLAAAITAVEHAITAPVQPRPAGVRAPLSFAQQRVWFLDQLQPGNAAYNMSGAMRLSGPLRIAAMEEALTQLVARHESLRTIFPVASGEPVQEVLPPAPVTIPVRDLRTLRPDLREAEALKLAEAEERSPFILTEGPCLRISLLRLEETEHVLLLTMHHIISDGWSIAIFMRELGELYRAALEGEPASLSPLPVQYGDYALWQREHLESERLHMQLAYWQEQLAGCSTVLELPADHQRPPVQRDHGRLHTFTLPRHLADRLKAFSRREGVTLFMTLLAAWGTLLSRYSGQEDLLVGAPIAGRERRELEGLIGFFANTLVLRLDLKGSPTFRELVRRVRETALGAYAHQDVPFEKLVELVQPQRDLSRHPLFQAAFVMQNTPNATLDLAGLKLRPLGVEVTTSQFDLTLYWEETADGLLGRLQYNTDLYDQPTIERMAGHIATLLDGAAANPAETAGRLPLLTAAERHQLVVAWNETDVPFPEHLCLHQLFEEQAARTPKRIAAVYGEETLTYAELDARANQLAHHLRTLGVGPDVAVGVCAERSLHLVVALLGILKAGGAFVPLETDAPPARLRQVLQDAQAPVCLALATSRQRLPADLLTCLFLDADRDRLESYPTDAPAVDVRPEHLVSIYYTSGSTGKPKGVANLHSGWVNRMCWMQREHQLGPDETVLQKTTLTFDDSAVELFWPLMVGARIAFLEPELHRDPRAILDAAVRYQVAVLQFVPSMLALVVDAITPADRAQLGCLRHIISSGEALRSELVRLFQERIGCKLHNQWGATEVAIDSTLHTCTPDDGRDGAIVPVGRPIDNNQVYILDEFGAPVPIGVPGELYLGGVGLARGYLNNPERTREAFVANPFRSDTLLYKTGDRGFYRSDGRICFLGRRDDQIKVRGQRVELGEIEAVLATHPAVKECAIVARKRADGYWLIGYFVPRDENCTSEALRAYLAERLPQYMVPGRLIRMAQMPVTTSGKLDRSQLPDPGDERPELAQGYVAPRTPLEAAVAAIWEELLGVALVGVQDDFFELGGHSLLATRVIARIRAQFSMDLPLRALFEAPTVAGLADRLNAAGKTEAPPVRPVPRTEALPLSFAQQRLWFLEQLEPGNSVYNIPAALRLTGDLDLAALEWSLADLIRRHEVLRTRIGLQAGESVQVIEPEIPLPLTIQDVTDLPDATWEQLVQEEAQAPFDLSRGPLIRFRLLRLGARSHLLLITFHHIITDGWSTGVFLRELGALYGAHTAGQPSPLAELPVQYADYAAWERSRLQGAVLESRLAYWRGQLGSGSPVLQLPADRPRPAVMRYKGASQRFELDGHLAAALRELSRREGATLFMTLLAGFQTLLYRYSGQTDISVGSPVANRTQAELEGLIGFFVNTLVLRGDLSGEQTFRELLRRTRECALGAYAYQDLPFEQLVEALKPERSLGHTPLFQVMFALQNVPAVPLEMAGLAVESLPVMSGTAKFDLNLALAEADGAILGAVEYNTDLFDAPTISRMLEHFRTLLAGIAASPDARLGTLPLLPEAERHMLARWNETNADYDLSRPLHMWVEEQAARRPEAEAVRFEGESLCYRELNERANQLAYHLRALGVGPEILVGICAERSPEMVVGLLGILKAGGAYLPLDPTYPAERLAFMLADSGVSVLLTQAYLATRLPPHEARLICLDSDWSEIARCSSANPDVAVTPEHLAYVIYTSGSTGRPKGAMIDHRSVVNRLCWMQEAYGLTPLDRVLQKTPFSFDVSVWEFFWPLMTGAALVLARPEGHKDPAYLAELIRAEGITTLHFVPSMLQLFLDEPAAAGCDSIRRVFSSGEALPYELQERFYARLGSADLHNLYGPTEAAVDVSFWACERNSARRIVPIGRPVANTQLYILDERLQPVPIGVAGELHIGGVQVGRGYLNRSELTAEKFIPDPLSNRPGATLYKTGDLARYLLDGAIEYLGRIDHQVKIRGFRIELGEIEAALAEHPGVREAVVTAREDQPGDKRLVAYVVAASEEPAQAELRAFLARRLPDYMVPNAFVTLGAMPLSPNGKVDRRALPAPEVTVGSAGDYVAPRDRLEIQLVQIWEDVLGVAPVGRENNFFELGGHSLMAVRLIDQVQRATGWKLPVAAIFQNATVGGMAELLRNQAGGAPWSPLVGLRTRGSKPPFFCVHGGFGSVFCLVDLARALPQDRPLYGLQPFGLLGEGTPLNDVWAMAESYLAAIRQVQPHGPYLLGGYCMGGMVALEMARRLQAAGESVDLVAMLDTRLLPPGEEPPRHTDAAFVDAFAIGLAGRSPEFADRYRQMTRTEQLLAIMDLARKVKFLPPEITEPEQVPDWVRTYRGNLTATLTYVPDPFAGPVTLFVATEQDLSDPKIGWGEAPLSGLSTCMVPGNHETMLEPPHVQELAAQLQACIAETESRREKSHGTA